MLTAKQICITKLHLFLPPLECREFQPCNLTRYDAVYRDIPPFEDEGAMLLRNVGSR